MKYRAHQKRNDHGNRLRETDSGGEVDMAEKEMMNGDIPLAREFEPVEISGLEAVEIDLIYCTYQSQEFHQSE